MPANIIVVNGSIEYTVPDSAMPGIMALLELHEPQRHDLSPSEALYAFVGWLTTRPDAITMGAFHNTAPAADVVDEFCKSQGFAEPQEGWAKRLRSYPSKTREIPQEETE